MEVKWNAAAADREAAIVRVNAAKRRAEQHAELTAKLSEPIAGPSEDAVLEAGAKMAEAKFARDVAAESLALRDAEGRRATTLRLAGDADADAKELRGEVSDLHLRVAQYLKARKVEGVTFTESGALAAITDDGPRDFDTRLSTGQQIRAALRIAAPRLQGVVFLDAQYWAALDDDGHAEVAAAAEELDLIVITEQPSEGGLDCRRYEPASGAA
jgi:hypothetical protein